VQLAQKINTQFSLKYITVRRIPSSGRSNTLSCYRNEGKLWPCGHPWLMCDLTFIICVADSHMWVCFWGKPDLDNLYIHLSIPPSVHPRYFLKTTPYHCPFVREEIEEKIRNPLCAILTLFRQAFFWSSGTGVQFLELLNCENIRAVASKFTEQIVHIKLFPLRSATWAGDVIWF